MAARDRTRDGGPNPALVGVFVLIAMALGVAAIVTWGSDRFFRETVTFVTYIPGSVNGLAPGAPVKYRGVPIGHVDEIRVRYRQAPEDTRVPVLLNLRRDRLTELGAAVAEGPAVPDVPKVVGELVGRGLRARLELQSLVTGYLYVNLEFVPDSPVEPAELADAPDDALPEIPAIPAPFDEATRTLGALLERIAEIDFVAIGQSVERAAAGAERLANAPELRATIASMGEAAQTMNRLARSLDTRVPAMTTRIERVAAETSRTLERLDGLIAGTRALMSSAGPAAANLSQTLDEIEAAARSVRQLAEFLQRNPGSLVSGQRGR